MTLAAPRVSLPMYFRNNLTNQMLVATGTKNMENPQPSNGNRTSIGGQVSTERQRDRHATACKQDITYAILPMLHMKRVLAFLQPIPTEHDVYDLGLQNIQFVIKTWAKEWGTPFAILISTKCHGPNALRYPDTQRKGTLGHQHRRLRLLDKAPLSGG